MRQMYWSCCAKFDLNVDVVQDASNVNIKHLDSPQGQEIVHFSILGILFARYHRRKTDIKRLQNGLIKMGAEILHAAIT